MLGTILGMMRSLALLGFLCIAGCASPGPASPVAGDISISAQQAVDWLPQEKIRLIDARSLGERSFGQIFDSLPIQFGPDHWTAAVSESDKTIFLARVTAAGLGQHDPIVTVCNVGVRSLAAAKFLRSAGFTNVRSLVGGYIGNDSDPGWQFFQ